MPHNKSSKAKGRPVHNGGFVSSGIVVGKTPQTRRDHISEQLKGNRVTMGTNVPTQAEGAVGDITVRDVISVGLRCYIKTDSGWFDINSLIGTFRINWIDMNLDNSWLRYSTGTQKPQFCKDQNGFVHFRGVMKDGGAQDTFTTLPEGFRPSTKIFIPVYKSGTINVALEITAAGACSFNTGTSNGQEYIDGISFFAHQKVTSIGAGSTVSQDQFPSGFPVL